MPKLPNVVGLVKVGKAFVQANRPEMLLGASVVASVGSTIMAAIGGYRSGKHVEATNCARDLVGAEPMSKAEIVTETWQNYVPAVGLCVGAVAGTVGLHAVHVKDKKALVATALAAVEEVREEAAAYVETLNEAVEDHTTEKNREKIRAAILEKSADRNNGMARIMNSDGLIEELWVCRESFGGRDKWSNKLEVDEALMLLNEELTQDGEVGLATFYSHWGITGSDVGDEMGWRGAERVTARWSTTRGDNGRPISVFTLEPAPHSAWDKSR